MSQAIEFTGPNRRSASVGVTPSKARTHSLRVKRS